jgi:hypothetical protein
MLEALVLHYADDLDAKMNAAGQLLANVQAGEWSDYDRSFARSFFKPTAVEEGRRGKGDQDTAESVFDLFRDRP